MSTIFDGINKNDNNRQKSIFIKYEPTSLETIINSITNALLPKILLIKLPGLFQILLQIKHNTHLYVFKINIKSGKNH